MASWGVGVEAVCVRSRTGTARQKSKAAIVTLGRYFTGQPSSGRSFYSRLPPLRLLLFSAIFRGGQFVSFSASPAGLVGLAAARDAQGIGGHVVGDGRARGHVRAVADPYRRDQSRIAADEDLIPDRGGLFVKAIVIAGDRARADIGLAAQLGVPQIGQVQGLGALADHAFLHFHKIADARAAL